MIKIGIVGVGFVGGAMMDSFQNKIDSLSLSHKYNIVVYDKFKQIGSIEQCLDAHIIFTALPTLYDRCGKNYDNGPTFEVVELLHNAGYAGVIVIKSTVEPLFTSKISQLYPSISFIHNPEFLTARTAFEDFHNQKHIVLGRSLSCTDENFVLVYDFYNDCYSNATISECLSDESECMKIFCNAFYAVKVQYFTEIRSTTDSIGIDYGNVVSLMLKNGWINPMHTKVPGPDGKLSYGGLCFPKDTNALLQFMKKHHSIYKVLEATIAERDEMRSDNQNIKDDATSAHDQNTSK